MTEAPKPAKSILTTLSALGALGLVLASGAAAQEAKPAPPAIPAAAAPAAAPAALALPPGVRQVRFGTAVKDRSATGVPRCTIPEPLPAPPRFEPGTTEIAYTIEVDPQTVKKVDAKVVGDPGCGAEPWTTGCVGFTVCGGGVCQNQFGATLSCPNGKPLQKGAYQLSLTVGGETVLLPFAIQ